MGQFALAAIKVLKEIGKPLHVRDITKIAIEKGLIETTGQTPERTMSTELRRDIQARGEKSAFSMVGQATFSLSPNYSERDEKLEEKEEQRRELEQESEVISRQFIGKAGEHLVQSELLFRGFNASIMPVDEGMDLVATKGKDLFNIQVKTSQEQRGKHNIHLTVSSFKRNKSSRTFYAFVLRGTETHILVLPYHALQKFIDEGDLVIDSSNKYRVEIMAENGKYFLGKKHHDISYYAGKWEAIRYISFSPYENLALGVLAPIL